MRLLRVLLLCAFAVSSLNGSELRRAVFILAGDPVFFDSSFAPQFTENQLRNTAEATRIGLCRWASTAEGHKLITYCLENELVVTVTENSDEQGIGRAPEPRLASLVAAAHHSRVRNFELVLNPDYFRLPEGMVPLRNEPATAADAMAAAWAGEMLHIYFYARGIGLPHHLRADFQDQWHEVAAELGMPSITHDDDEHGRHIGRRPVIHWIE